MTHLLVKYLSNNQKTPNCAGGRTMVNIPTHPIFPISAQLGKHGVW